MSTTDAPRAFPDAAWEGVRSYLRYLGQHENVVATAVLDETVDTEGIGAVNDALTDVCRSLMDRIEFPPGTVDIHAVIDWIARMVVAFTHDEQEHAVERQRSLVVFLGSEGLPCSARADVATWSPAERLRALVACTLGLLGIVAARDDADLAATAERVDRPGPPNDAEGTFTLAWRGPDGAEPLAGVIPRGYTAHITFLGSDTCSLRSIFARVARLRDEPALNLPTPQANATSS